jgi:hypothetical protein
MGAKNLSSTTGQVRLEFFDPHALLEGFGGFT